MNRTAEEECGDYKLISSESGPYYPNLTSDAQNK